MKVTIEYEREPGSNHWFAAAPHATFLPGFCHAGFVEVYKRVRTSTRCWITVEAFHTMSIKIEFVRPQAVEIQRPPLNDNGTTKPNTLHCVDEYERKDVALPSPLHEFATFWIECGRRVWFLVETD